MYIRPQLSRKKTIDYKTLTREHLSEMEEYDKSLKIGEEYRLYADKIRKIIKDLKFDENLSLEEKLPIIREMNSLLIDVEQKYQINVENEQREIDYSSNQRKNEMLEAKDQIQRQKMDIKDVMFQTNIVNKENLEVNISVLLKKYQLMVDEAMKDVNVRRKKADIQREKIKERLAKTT